MTNKIHLNKAKAKKTSLNILLNVFRYTMIICLSFLILQPIFKQLSLAFMSPADLGLPTTVWIPKNFSIENVVVAFYGLNYISSVLYTLCINLILMLLQTACAAFAGYAFARLKFKGMGIAFGCVILTIIIAPQTIMLPQFIFFKDLGLLQNPASLFILAATGMGLKSGLYIYIFRQFFRGLPKELEEAAFVDGAGFLRTFFTIVLPSAKAGILTVMVLSFVWNWNDKYFSNMFNPSDNNLSLAYAKFTSMPDGIINGVSSKVPADYYLMSNNPLYQNAILQSASLLVILPLIVLYMFIQKQFVQGVERSGVVG